MQQIIDEQEINKMFGPADLEEDEMNVLGDEPCVILRY